MRWENMRSRGRRNYSVPVWTVLSLLVEVETDETEWDCEIERSSVGYPRSNYVGSSPI